MGKHNKGQDSSTLYVCSGCLVWAMEDQFPRRSDGYRIASKCKSCKNEKSKVDYRKSAAARCEQINKRRLDNTCKQVDLLKSSSCADCGCADCRLLQFDHVTGTKKFGISRAVRTMNWDSVLVEIEKCETVCVNCHRIRTATRLGSFKVTGAKRSAQRKLLEFLNGRFCVECGESNVIVLEFDHLRDKIAPIATMVNRKVPWRKIEDEIGKCQILCANCHTLKTCLAQGWAGKVDQETLNA